MSKKPKEKPLSIRGNSNNRAHWRNLRNPTFASNLEKKKGRIISKTSRVSQSQTLLMLKQSEKLESPDKIRPA
jgi:hypothetical protein